jgi:4a-hydroxytetrahydrobiopterin dehydratase
MATKMTASEIEQGLQSLAGWSADGERAIAKAYQFGDHIEAMGFVNKVALAAEKMDHHPELTIVYNNVKVRLSTHDVGGVSAKDFELAAAIERYR